MGGVAAIVVAWVGLRVLLALAPAGLPRLANVHLSLPVLALSAALSLATSIAFGILPAVRALRMQPIQAMQVASGRVAGEGRSGGWLRQGILALQLGCSVVLLVATGVVTQSFGRLLTQAQAFASEPVTMAQADLQAPQYSDGGSLPDNAGADAGSLHRDATIDETLRRLAALPGVETAALTSVLPLTGDISVDGVERPDHPLPQGQTPLANLRMVAPGYFRALGIPLQQGRDFAAGDRNHARVTIVSAATARAAWGQESPIGHTLLHWGRTYTVIGVAADARINDLRRDASIFYLPYWDYPPFSPVYLVQTSPGTQTGPPHAALLDPQQIRKAIWSVDPQVAIPTVLPLKVQTAQSVALERFQALLLGGFGVAALLLAALGVYGVLSYEVNLRNREWGIRMALGSSRGRLFRRILLRAATPAGVGALLGTAGAFFAVRWLQSFLYGAQTTDLLALLGALGSLALVVLAASLLPARRAAAAEPADVLRGE